MGKQDSMEEKLWKTAIKLRGSVEASEYKHIVLGLIFLKYAGDKFEQQQNKLISEGKEKYIDIPEFYSKDNIFFLPENTRWSYIIDNAKQDNITTILDTAFADIEKKNKSLRGALPSNYYTRLDLEKKKLTSLLDVINSIDTTDDTEQDIIGRVYEYFLGQFAIKEGIGKGEFYTPKSVVSLIAEIIEPYDGTIYDPCCGSGGMFVQSLKFIKSHQGNTKNVSVYGQENVSTTRKLALMNLAIRGISADLGKKAADTFFDDQHIDKRFDYIMANPPFNISDWREENELITDYRWNGYDVPPTSNANYAWILHILSKLSENGIGGIILANGSLNTSDTKEYNIRKTLIENNLIEAILVLPAKLFYSTNIPVTLWILNKNKKQRSIVKNNKIINFRDRKNEILFMDLRNFGSIYNKKFVELTQGDRDKIVNIIHTWQTEDYSSKYKDIPELCYSASIEEIREKEYKLAPSAYIEFKNNNEDEMDFDKEMTKLSQELSELLKEEVDSTNKLIKIMEDLNYEIQL